MFTPGPRRVCYLTHDIHAQWSPQHTRASCCISSFHRVLSSCQQSAGPFSCPPHLLPIIKYTSKMSPAPERAKAGNRSIHISCSIDFSLNFLVVSLRVVSVQFFYSFILLLLFFLWYCRVLLLPAIPFVQYVTQYPVLASLHHPPFPIYPTFSAFPSFGPATVLSCLSEPNCMNEHGGSAGASLQTPPQTTAVVTLTSIFTSFSSYHFDIIKAPSLQRIHLLSPPFYTFLRTAPVCVCVCVCLLCVSSIPRLYFHSFSSYLSCSLSVDWKKNSASENAQCLFSFLSRWQKPVAVFLCMKVLDIFCFFKEKCREQSWAGTSDRVPHSSFCLLILKVMFLFASLEIYFLFHL